MATNTSRKIARKHLADLLRTQLVTVLGIAQAVYDYQIGDFQGASPVVVVSSGGTYRQPLTFRGAKPTYFLNIHVFVVYNTTDGAWTESNAEDALDDIEGAIGAVIAANPSYEGYWISLDQVQRSDAGSVLFSGVEYRTEVYEVKIE